MDQFVIKTSPAGVLQLEINGQDVMPLVKGLQFQCRVGDIPLLFLETIGTQTIEGIAEVQTIPEMIDVSTVFCEVLDSINPAEIEKEALNDFGWDDEDTVTNKIFRALKRRVVNGSQSGSGPS